jgi:hypothetical protein
VHRASTRAGGRPQSGWGGHRDVPLPRHQSGVDEAQFAQVSELGVTQVQRSIVAVAEGLGWDNSEGTDGGQRAAFRAAQRVLAIAVEYPFAVGAARQVELAQEHLSRVPTVALTRVAVSRILVALSGIFSGSRIMLEHGRACESKRLPHFAACDHSWRRDSNNRQRLHQLAAV